MKNTMHTIPFTHLGEFLLDCLSDVFFKDKYPNFEVGLKCILMVFPYFIIDRMEAGANIFPLYIPNFFQSGGADMGMLRYTNNNALQISQHGGYLISSISI